MVLFDLPNVSKAEKRNYAKFRKEIMNDGFMMLQYSIYTRFCRDVQDAQKHIKRVKLAAPQDGNIRILCVTEKQYEDMILVIGEKSPTEEAIKKDYVVVIE